MIVLTVPHSECRLTDVRDCDRAAMRFASALHRAIPESVVLPSHYYRPEMDANRIASRKTPYREKLRQALDHADMLLDIHSFPAIPGVWGDDVPPDTPLVVLSMDETLGYKLALNRRLARLNFTVILQGSMENDIAVEAWQRHRCPSVLLEINESLDSDTIKQIAKMISRLI